MTEADRQYRFATRNFQRLRSPQGEAALTTTVAATSKVDTEGPRGRDTESPAPITVIELWPFYSTCQKCGCETRAKLAWPYYEDFIIGDGEPWQEHGGYVPVCEWCYRELIELEESSPRARQVKAMEVYETHSAGGLPCGGSDMSESPAQDARQQRSMPSQVCEGLTARRDGTLQRHMSTPNRVTQGDST